MYHFQSADIRSQVRSSQFLRGGVSLLEVTLSMLIIGVMTAIAAPIYSSSLLRYRAEVTAQRIVQDIVQTQRTSRQTNSVRNITFDRGSQSYTISGISSLDRVSQPYRVSLSQPEYRTGFTSLVTATQPTVELSSLSLAFDRFGMPNQGISVTVGTGTFQKRIDVNPTSGRVSVQ